VKVTIDGRPSAPDLPGLPRRRLIGPILFGLAALAAVGLVGNSAFESVNDQPSLAEDQFLSERVAGLEGSLEMIVERSFDTYYVSWALDRARPSETLLNVIDARLNADGTLIAGRGREVPDLWVGTSGTITPVSTDALSFAWHQNDPNRIAAIRLLGNRYQLWIGERAESGGFQFSTFADVAEGLSVAAYGDWGIALEALFPSRGTDFFMVYDNDGKAVDRRDGRILGSWPGVDGGVVVSDGDDQITLSPSGGPADLAIPGRRPLEALFWNSTGQLVAALILDEGTARTEVTAAGEVAAEADGMPVGWVKNSQLVLVASPNTLGFLDPSDGSLETLEINGTIVDAALRGN